MIELIPQTIADAEGLLTRLSTEPVMGVSMAHVALLRLDRVGGLAPGNKSFKLYGNIAEAKARGVDTLVSFGGSWSNHLHALAAAAHEQGLQSVGLVRGGERDSAMLEDARAWGMQLEYLSRSEYRRRNEVDYQEQLLQRFAPCLLLPEGGANPQGVAGCRQIAALIRQLAPGVPRILLAVGTGTTLAGIVAGLGLTSPAEIIGISALKGAEDLEQRVHVALHAAEAAEHAPWQILHEYHCGGFARVTAGLREFMLAFEAVHGVPLEPVYTGKMLYAIHQRCSSGQWDCDTPILAIHTGGLQGRRGYSW